MKNASKVILTTLLLTILFATPLYAQGQGQGSENSNAPELPGQVKEQVQQKTKNEGEDVQIQIQNEESVQEGTEESTEPASQIAPGIGRGMGSRSDMAREKMSDVAKKAEELISQGAQFQGGIGEEISEVARQQRNAVDEAEEALDQIDRRKGLTKFILGPNQEAIAEMETIRQRNQERIQELQELKNQVANEADAENIQEMIQTVEESNSVLGEKVQEELQSFSLFGLFRKLFSL